MKCIIVLAIFFISGCAGPKYIASSIDEGLVDLEPKIRVIRDEKTRAGFEKAVVKWLDESMMAYELVPSNSEHNPDFLNLEYTGRWSWDLGLFLADAKIKASHKGENVGVVKYQAPNTLSSSKFGDAEERIGYMMDVLFGYQTAESATKSVN